MPGEVAKALCAHCVEILGATTLQSYGLALFVGLLSGAYSSIFIASPVLCMMKEREDRWRTVAKRQAQRGEDHNWYSAVDAATKAGAQEVDNIVQLTIPPVSLALLRRSAARRTYLLTGLVAPHVLQQAAKELAVQPPRSSR